MSISKKRQRDDVAAGDAEARDSDALFKFLLNISEKEFFGSYFEKKSLVFHRSSTGIAGFFADHPVPDVSLALDWSSRRMVQLCAEKTLHYTTDINVVKYDGALKKRVPYKTEGTVAAAELESCFAEGGWSVRFLRPQEHSAVVSAVVEAFEKLFQCSCGVNSYWTPKDSQGFAPHYDDVDVFLLQLEGSKRWRLYTAPEEVDILSRHSSEDYVPEQLPPPFLTTTLRAGDVLYMPRGTVHQGDTTVDHQDSLHVTFSAFQMHSMADLVKTMTSYQIETLAANDVNWRRGVPRTWFCSLGYAYSRACYDETGVCALRKEDSEHRASNLKLVRQFVSQLSDSLQLATVIDHCVDQYAVNTIAKCQPPSAPPLPSSSRAVVPDSRVVLVSDHCVRLVMSCPAEAQVFHLGSNSTVCLEWPVGKLRFDRDFAAAIATLIAAFPNPVTVSSLPMPAFEDADAAENRAVLVQTLIDAKVLRFVQQRMRGE